MSQMNRRTRGGGHRPGGDRSRDDCSSGRQPTPSETWVPPKPRTSQKIPPLPAPTECSPFPDPNTIIPLPQPQAPGRVCFASLVYFTNYYELKLGRNLSMVYFYSVEISRIEKDSGSSLKKNSNSRWAGPHRERKLALEDKKKIFAQLRRQGLADSLLIHDGSKRALSLKKIPNDGFNAPISYDGDDWKVTLRYEKALSLETLKPGNGFGCSSEVEESRLALSLIFSHVASLLGTVPVGKGYFGLPGKRPRPIGGGLTLWSGFKFHVIIGVDRLYLNLNYANTTFVEPGTLIDLLPNLAGLKRGLPIKLDHRSIGELRNKLSRCRAETLHFVNRKQMKLTISSITEEPASQITFQDRDGSTVSVSQYFEKTHKRLRYPEWPCVKAGHAYFPLEVLRILDPNPFRGEHNSQLTSKIVKAASIQPRNRLEEIRATVGRLRTQLELVEELDLEVLDELEVPGRILPTPTLVAEKFKPVNVNPGVIDFRHATFLRGTTIKRWTVVNTCEEVPQEKICHFVSVLTKQGAVTGIKFEAPMTKSEGIFHTISERLDVTKVEASIEAFVRENKLEFVLFVISEFTPIHAAIKSLSDVKLGFRCKCVKSTTIDKVINNKYGPDQCVLNILYGLNLKFGGENVVGAGSEFGANLLSSCPTLIIGLDVNHGHAKNRSGVPRMPSTVGVVGTRNLNGTLYYAFMTAQGKPPTSSDTEIIQPQVLKPEIEKLIRLFFRDTKRKPERIIVYRDGVSNGQFNAALQTEMRAIVEVCSEVFGPAYRPLITFITVQKRHATLLFPTMVTLDKKGQEKQNPIAGTVVDGIMTSPNVWDYFGVSSEGIQGTSRPAHYVMLANENKFSNDQLQSLNYYLCYLYGKCPRSVSIPTPVYYAHHVAFRAAEIAAFEYFKNHGSAVNRSLSDDQLDEEEIRILYEYKRAIHVDESMAGSMYFL